MTIGNKTKMEILPLYAALAQNQAGMELAKNFSHFLIYSEVCLGGKFEKKTALIELQLLYYEKS